MTVATKSANDLMSLAEGADCGLACECEEAPACNWEFSEVPTTPGLYDVGAGDAALKCILCMAETSGGGPAETGTLEIVRVDDEGVVGCVVDSPCGGDLRFEATWCP